jgi:anti-sigma regulatory factor (Ser/Thr protein kinase)
LSHADAYQLARGGWADRAVRFTRIEIRAGLTAPREARWAVEAHLDDALGERELNEVRLMTSELVTNALRHGEISDGIVLHVAVSDRQVRVEVRDDGPGFAPSPDLQPGGYGLRLVDELATRWGASGDDGTCVWFELDLPGP